MPELREESFRYIGLASRTASCACPSRSPGLAPQAADLLDLRRARPRLHGGHHAVHRRSLLQLLRQATSRTLAVILLVLTLYRIFRKRVRLFTRTAPARLSRQEGALMSPPRPHGTRAAAVVALVLFVPWSRRTICERPRNGETHGHRPCSKPRRTRVVAQVCCCIQEGDRVVAGQAESSGWSAPRSRKRRRGSASERARLGGRVGRPRPPGTPRRATSSQSERAERFGRGRAHERPGAGGPARGIRGARSRGGMLTAHLRDLEGRSVPAGTQLAEVGDVNHLRPSFAVTERLLDDLAPKDGGHGALPRRMAPGAGARNHRRDCAGDGCPNPSTSRAGTRIPPHRANSPEQFVPLATFDNADGTLPAGHGRLRQDPWPARVVLPPAPGAS